MLEKFEVAIPALTGSKKRNAYVYLPDNFEGERFPVLYMFDGHNLFSDEEATFGKCWGLKDYLDSTNTPLIVAAVECNHEGNLRLSEYSPADFVFRNKDKIKGRGKKYMDWLVNEFKPLIDENFPTLSGRSSTAIAGSSMGGLMTLYALSKYNRVFSLGAALSPSLWVYGGEVPPFISSGKYGKDSIIFMSYGSCEFKNHSVQKKVYLETASALAEKGVNVTSDIVYGGTHSEASWEKLVPLFMNILGFMPKEIHL